MALASQLTNPQWDLRARWLIAISGDLQPGVPTAPALRALQRRLTSDDIERLVALYGAGATVAEVCAILGIHRTTALDHLSRAGVPRRRNDAKLVGVNLDEAVRLYREGLSLATVGEMFGVDAATVRRSIARTGGKIRPRNGAASNGRVGRRSWQTGR